MSFDIGSFDFGSGLYGSDGSSVAPAKTSDPIAKSDASMLDSFLKIVGVGATAYEKVVGAETAQKVAVTAAGPAKTAAPAIGTPAASGASTLTISNPVKYGLMAAAGLVLILLGFLAFRRK